MSSPAGFHLVMDILLLFNHFVYSGRWWRRRRQLKFDLPPLKVLRVCAWVSPLFHANNTAANECYEQVCKVHIRFSTVCCHFHGSTCNVLPVDQLWRTCQSWWPRASREHCVSRVLPLLDSKNRETMQFPGIIYLKCHERESVSHSPAGVWWLLPSWVI